MARPADLLDRLPDLVRAAGRATLDVYHSDFEVDQKDDRSPVTEADRRANEVLVAGLERHWPDIPVLTEEAKEVPYETRRAWDRFFLVDPLDGTKEFIRKNGEFTVNVALVEAGDPIAGVVGVPVQDVLYSGAAGVGARRTAEGATVPITVAAVPKGPLRVVASRSHRDAQTEAFLARLPPHETMACGSSLKICRIAEGKADIYPRFGPTMEWDTAAADAVLRAAGGRLVSIPDAHPLVYNKPDLHNPGFVASGPVDPRPYLLP